MEGDSTCRESFRWLLRSRLASITAALILCYFGPAPPYAPAWQGLSSPARVCVPKNFRMGFSSGDQQPQRGGRARTAVSGGAGGLWREALPSPGEPPSAPSPVPAGGQRCLVAGTWGTEPLTIS